MGIYIFSWPVLRDALVALKDQSNCDFGKHIIPYCHERDMRILRMNLMDIKGCWYFGFLLKPMESTI